VHGHETYLDNGGTYYEYITIDTTDPILIVGAPLISEPVTSTVIFNFTGFDAGSGTALFEIEIDSVNVLTDTVVPPSYTWQTTYLDNGNHTLSFIITDNADNFVEISYEYLVDHPVPWYAQTKNFILRWWPYLTAGGGALVVGIIALVIVVRVRKRRKVA
jgi:hypothetical protein